MRLSRKRRYRFMKLLLRQIDTVLRDVRTTPPPVFDQDDQDDLTGWADSAACSLCAGRCCLRGATDAHLDAESVHRYMAAHPTMTRTQVAAAYCSYLPQYSYRRSCVFHSAAGCALPRHMRSSLCLSFVCGGLSDMRNRIARDQQNEFFLAAQGAGDVIRCRHIAAPDTPSLSKNCRP